MNYTLLGTVEIDEKNMPREAGAINGGLMNAISALKAQF